MKMKCAVLILLLTDIMTLAFGQVPANLFRFSYPLSTRQKLNANFGEMRPNHFHMGLDLWTESRVNLPVYAPADGFVSRMKIETSGFGRALYIDHPNGTTTLYAHMNRFLQPAEQFLKEKQYELKSWKSDIIVPKELIPVRKGDLIGYSGNTGASQGPHVHFEIRETISEVCLNPQRLGLGPDDHTPPDIWKLAFYDRDRSIYEQRPVVFPVLKKGGNHLMPSVIQLPFEHAMLAIQASDKVTGEFNPKGIYSASFFRGDTYLSGFVLDSIGYDKTRYENGHIDFLTRHKGGPYFQMLYPPKGFGLGIYQPQQGMDHFTVPKEEESFRLMVGDAHGNLSSLDLKIKRLPRESLATSKGPNRMEPRQVNIYEDQNIRFVFGEEAFYDAFNFQVSTMNASGLSMISSVYQALPEYIPVQQPFTVSIKPNRNPVLIDTSKVIMKRTYRGKTEIKKAVIEKGMFSASFRDFGFFQLLEDKTPPVVMSGLLQGAVVKAGTVLQFQATDDNRIISEFNVYVDGQWLLFQPTWSNYRYVVDEHIPLGEHKLSVVVKDIAGNVTTREWNIKRN